MKSTTRTGLALALLAVATLAAACLGARGGRTNGAGPVWVQVESTNFNEVGVYVLSAGVTRRLGFVSTNRSTTFEISRHIHPPGNMRLAARLIGGQGSFVSEELTPAPGDTLVLQVQPNIATSYVNYR